MLKNVRLVKPTIDYKEQINNYKESFLKNKEIILVDDIYTTGSTLHQAAEILQREGAKSIKSVTIAR